MAADTGPGPCHRRVRDAVRAARLARGLTQQQAAAALDWSLSKMTRIETGAAGVSVCDLRALLGLYQVSEAGTGPLIEMARTARSAVHDHRAARPIRRRGYRKRAAAASHAGPAVTKPAATYGTSPQQTPSQPASRPAGCSMPPAGLMPQRPGQRPWSRPHPPASPPNGTSR
jgi:transcriptional regulator with XRE-family HTH domain